ncbi:MAG: MmcQ/YjbR family DNA-binding protein [Sphingobacterium sp.]
MDIEDFRLFCLSFPGTHEGLPFQGFFKNSRSILVFYVGKKMFCFFDIDKFDYCTMKCDPVIIEELKEQEGINEPFNLSPKYWVSVVLDGSVSDDIVKDLVTKSYLIVSSTLTKKAKK